MAIDVHSHAQVHVATAASEPISCPLVTMWRLVTT
jgi:hypothetical protein